MMALYDRIAHGYATRVSESRNREVVVGPQGGQHEGRVMGQGADLIAEDFAGRYEAAWAQGATAAASLYTADAVLVGHAVAVGRAEILKLLQGIMGVGWTATKIRIVNVRQVGDVILIANEYTAIGSGQNAGKTLDAKSSHVLVHGEGAWLSTLHTAR
jgi:uncharacterized protein (TIGR02246 family)